MAGANFGVVPSGVTGVSFGPTGAEYVADSCEIVAPDAAIACTSPPGVGRNLRARVTIGGQTSGLSDPSGGSLNYAAPSLETLDPADLPSTTGGRVTLSGSDFGHAHASRSSNGVAVTWGGIPLSIVALEATYVAVTVPPSLPSPSRLIFSHVVLTSRGAEHHRVESEPLDVSYAPPSISSATVERHRMAANDASLWQLLLHIQGANFGSVPPPSGGAKVGRSLLVNDVLSWTDTGIRVWSPVFDEANVSVVVDSSRSTERRLLHWRCGAGCSLAMLGNGVCEDPCNVRGCGFDDGDCVVCAQGLPVLHGRDDLFVAESAVVGQALASRFGSPELTLECPGEGSDRPVFTVVSVTAPSCGGLGATDAFAVHASSGRLHVAASLNREACARYKVRE